jgi:hypothetical protein
MEKEASNFLSDPNENTLRLSQIWTRCSTVKYRETLDASPEGGVCDYPPWATTTLSLIFMLNLITMYAI